MSNGSVDFYIDIKSPYAYLALDPAIKMFDHAYYSREGSRGGRSVGGGGCGCN